MSRMTEQEALSFVEENGVVLESARGPVPSLAERIVGRPMRGNWWGHPRGQDIFRLTRAVRASPDVLVCRLLDGKVTYVHRRVLPHLVKLSSQFPPAALTSIREIHTESGRHVVKSMPFPKWVAPEVTAEAARLSEEEARSALTIVLAALRSRSGRRGTGR